MTRQNVEASVLTALVHPPDWTNPRPAPMYDLVVLGGGTAGLVSAMGAAGFGARVAIVERHLLGGDCLNTGCVPSKALLRSARAIGDIRSAGKLGVRVSAPSVDFPAAMQRMRERRDTIAEHDAAARLRGAGVDVFFGSARFADPRTVVVDGSRLRFGRAVIATGGRPAAPPIQGLDTVPFLTSENVFALTELPPRLLVIGGGPIGCEMAQAFARFGAAVTVLHRGHQILPKEDADAASIVRRHLERDGVRFELGVSIERASHGTAGIALHYSRTEDGRAPSSGHVVGDALLVAAGRAPNVEGLDLDAAGIKSTSDGVVVTGRMQTTNRRVFASGDVCSKYKFTHVADAQSRIVLQNALFFGRRKAGRLVVPWVTFTDPELAHVGVSEKDVNGSGGTLRTITVDLSEVDRAIVDDETDGFVRVHHEGGTLRGCTIVARHAGEMIGEAAYAMTHGGTLTALSGTIHPYPTQAEALRRAGDAYRRESLTPGIRRWFERYFRWTR